MQKTIEQDEDVERYGSGIFLGAGMDERFGFSVEVRYGDKWKPQRQGAFQEMCGKSDGKHFEALGIVRDGSESTQTKMFIKRDIM